MSRLSELLKELLTQQRLTQADVVRRADELGLPVSKGTVSTYFSNPPQRPRRQVLEALAAVFDVSVSDLEQAATFTGREPFTPDPSADRLTQQQRAVLNDLIRVMAAGNTEEGDGDAEATPPTRAAGSAANDDGLGAFGHRDRGDLDHESINDGAGDNVHRLRPDLDTMAAYRTGKETEKQRLLREEAEREDESQDPEDWE